VASTKGSSEPLLSPAKRRVFLIITVLFPFVLLLLTEIFLRVVKYGPDLSLFMPETVHGKSYVLMNPQVKSRYFSRIDFRPGTAPDYFQVPKPAGTYRIFCLGGSTTVGYPYWFNGSFSVFLRDRLRATFPQKKIEIINIGMTATNSFTVLDLARDLTDYEPDLFLVYDGHNEFYGALGIASHESLGASRWLISSYLRLIHLRTFLLFRDIYNAFGSLFARGGNADPSGTMMEQLAIGSYVPYRSPEYRDALSMFAGNLADFCALASRAKVSAILSSQVSNLRDQPPFVSGESLNLDPTRRSSFNLFYNQGMTLWMNGKVDSALLSFREAAVLDSTRADVHYEIARCLDTLGRKHEAMAEYVSARDRDQLRFRTSSDFNDAIAASAAAGGAIYLNMEELFRGHSPDSLIGKNLITEHLHPNSVGFFLMAKGYARAMRLHNLLADSATWARQDTISDPVLWQNRAVTLLDDRIAQRRTDILTSGWPFKPGPPTVKAVAPDDTLGQIVERVTRGRLDWPGAHEEAATYYLGRGEQQKAALEYATIINEIPVVDVQPYLKLARIELALGNTNAVRTILTASLDVEKTLLAYRALGDIALNRGNPVEAEYYYEKMSQFPQSTQERLENGYKLSLAYSQTGKTGKATGLLLEILKLKPDYSPAVNLLVRLKSARLDQKR
jgi:tetratricopeptide (TPR) repeat protein